MTQIKSLQTVAAAGGGRNIEALDKSDENKCNAWCVEQQYRIRGTVLFALRPLPWPADALFSQVSIHALTHPERGAAHG